MKSIEDLELLRNNLIDNFYKEGTRLSVWDSVDLANMEKEGEEIRIVKANSQLMANLGASISSLNTMIKQMKTKPTDAKVNPGVLALERIRNGDQS